MQALQAYRDYQESIFGKYDSYIASVLDGLDDDGFAIDGESCYQLFHMRRASFILYRDSRGFVYSQEYASADRAQRALDDIADQISRELESAAWEAHPDRWVIHAPAHYPFAYFAEHDSVDDAGVELSSMRDNIGRQIERGASVKMYIDDVTMFEVCDSDDAIMISPLVGRYFIDHIDNSDARDRFIEMNY